MQEFETGNLLIHVSVRIQSSKALPPQSQASQNVPPPLRQQQRPSAASLIPQDLKKSLMTIPKSALQQVRKLGELC